MTYELILTCVDPKDTFSTEMCEWVAKNVGLSKSKGVFEIDKHTAQIITKNLGRRMLSFTMWYGQDTDSKPDMWTKKTTIKKIHSSGREIISAKSFRLHMSGFSAIIINAIK